MIYTAWRSVTARTMRMSTGISRFMLLAVALVGCSNSATPTPSAPLVGRWIRVYPPDRALDTLILTANGEILGSVIGFDSLGFRITRWKIGSPVQPGALCVGDGKSQLCQGYVLTGDTLWLANGRKTVYLRLPAQPEHVTIEPWNSPKGIALPPAPGGRAVRPPAGFTKKGAT